jgi:hypothetical protein
MKVASAEAVGDVRVGLVRDGLPFFNCPVTKKWYLLIAAIFANPSRLSCSAA